MRSAALRTIVVAGLLAGLGGPIAGESSIHGAGETFRSPWRGETWRAVRDDATGRKWFESSTGERADSPAEIALHEWRTLPALQQTVDPSLADAVTDPARAEEPADVTILFRRQPAHDAGADARARYAPLFAPHLARAREIVSRLPARRADPDAADPAEDERLLTAEEKSELRAARDEVLALAARMRREVAERASAECGADQAGVRAWLAARTDVVVFGSSWILSTVSARVPLGAIEELVATFPEIARVARCGVSHPTLNVSVPTISASTWWNAGYTGSSSTKVAILDTGIDGGHPALTVSNTSVHLGTGALQSDFNDNASSTDDLHGHGTHVAGIVASNDSTNKGVAPGAGLMTAKCGYLTTGGGGSLQDPDIFGAGDWAATYGASVMNCSFGGGANPNDGSSGMSLFFDAVVFALSVDVAIASGNSGGSSGSVLSPGDAFNVVTVGNFNDNGSTSWSDDSLAGSSSRGPTNDGRRKPDISAPGSNITSCNAFWEGSANDFISFSGTSMASPHVAGSLALLRDYAASWSPEGLKALLLTTSRNASPAPTSPDNNWGWGGLDLGRAYTDRASVLEGTVTSTGASDVFVQLGSLSSGGRVTLAWNRHVASNGANAPVTSYALLDMDLHVHDPATGSSAGSSTSTVNPVEQVKLSSALTAPIARIHVAGQFPTGVSTDYWAIASETTSSATVVDPPELVCSFAQGLPSPVGPGATFTLPVTVTNNGDLTAFAPVVTLTLPSGYTCAETGASVTIGNVAAGGSGTATFHVTTSTGSSAQKTIKATASTNSFSVQFTGATISATQTLDADPPAGSVSVDSGAAFTGTTNVTLSLSASDSVAGVDSMRLRNPGGAWTSWETFAASRAWTLSTGDGPESVDVEIRDKVGNVGSATDSISLDTTPPSGAAVLNGGGPYTNAASVSLSANATDALSGVADQRVSSDGSSYGAWETYGTTHTVVLPSGEGTTSRWVEFRDAVGNVSAGFSTSVLRDLTPPTGSVVVNGGAGFTNQAWVQVATAAADNLSGVVEMRVGTNGNAWTGWFPYLANVDMQLPNMEALNTVYAQYRDGAGNTSALYSAAIFVDATGPDGTIEIEGGARYTAASSVTLTLAGSDASSGVASMRLRDDGGEWGAWQTYAASAQWTLPAGEGDRIVHAQFRDGAGNVSGDVSATITRDLTPPAGSVAILGGAAAVNRPGVEVDLAATDAASGVADVRVANDDGVWTDWEPLAAKVPIDLSAGEGVRTVRAQFRDAVGNESAVVSASILVDMTPPSGSFTVNGGAAFVLPWETLAAEPAADDGADGSGVVSIEFSVDGGATWSAPESVAGPPAIDRSAAAVDARTEIQARFRDAAGNVSAPSAASSYLVAAPVQGLDSARTLKGAIAAGGDVDSYTVELVEGDALTIRQTVKSAKKRGALGADLDVYGPSHAKLVDGRWPAGSKRAGVGKFVAPATGTYVVVVRPTGADADAGGTYSLAANVVRARSRQRWRGTAVQDQDGGSASIATTSFAGTQGGTVAGTVNVLAPMAFELVAPDGSVTPFVAAPKRGLAKVSLPLTGGTGRYTLNATTYGIVPFALTLNPARRAARASETLPPGQR